MKDEFSLTPRQSAETLREIKDCETVSAQYGLSLTDAEILGLVESRKQALISAGRVEFGGGIMPKLITAFCDSPFIERGSWADTLAELQEAFYYFKTESEDRFTDDELISFMADVFNGRAQGSAEYLIGTSLEELCRYARRDFDEHDADVSGDTF